MRELNEEAGFRHIDCYLEATQEVCESRDTNKLYLKAKAGALENFSGVTEQYEAPQKPEIHLDAGTNTVELSVTQIITYLFDNGILFDNSEPWVAPSLIKPMTITEKEEISKLAVLDIDLEQAQYLQTISEGWAYPLARFMNEVELIEVL